MTIRRGRSKMSGKMKYSGMALLLAALVGLACVSLWRREASSSGEEPRSETSAEGSDSPGVKRTLQSVPSAIEKADDDEASAADEDEEEEPQTEEEKREAAEEALVEAFDDLTDKWTEPAEKGVSMADVDNFAATFKKLPVERRDECLHRALNLVPDENVMLLAGILMDKTLGQETVETVFNDILNRDDEVKKPILQQVFRDKTHPCWADAAWILDVTDELPEKK